MEDLLIVLAVIVVVGVPLAVIGLLIWAARLNRRLGDVEQQIAALQSVPSTSVDRDAPGAKAHAKPLAIKEKSTRSTPEKDRANAPVPPPSQPEAPPVPPPHAPPKAVVFRADKARALGAWMSANWIYVVAAVSLAAAGIFLVQYGIEKGWLSPVARVLGALAFGGAMVWAGETLRRRWGDDEDSVTAHLPSVFSGAGVVTLFAAVLAAQHLYSLIGPVMALIGLIVVAVVAIVLGWFSGPLLAGLGVAGAFAAPFMVGGESDAPELFYFYFGLFTLVGLAIDAVRRWAWVSVLTLGMAYGAAYLLHEQIGQPEYYMGLLILIVLLAVAVPIRSLSPAHGGAGLADCFRPGLPEGWPGFPTRLAAGSVVISAGIIAALSTVDAGTFWLACALEVALFAAIAVWARGAGALEDLALWPTLVLLALPLVQVTEGGEVWRTFAGFTQAAPGTNMPVSPFVLVALAAGISLVAAWRSLSDVRWPVPWAAGAALAAPLMVLGLDLRWHPGEVIGAYPWALTAAALAVMMGLLAGAFGRADGGDRLRTALVVLAALSMMSFALVQVLSETALTLALAVTTLAAAALDRRFTLKPMTWFVIADAIVVAFRLILDPGLGWAWNAPYWELFLAYGGTIAALVGGLPLLRARNRTQAHAIAGSAAWTLLAVFASVLLIRLIKDLIGSGDTDSHWALGLTALIWFASAANQVWRLKLGDVLRWVRLVLAVLYGAIGLLLLAVAVTLQSPLLGWNELVAGPILINTLIPAYLLPALAFAAFASRFPGIGRTGRLVLLSAAAALGVYWLGLAIRHAWQGPDLSQPGVTQYELYSYTIAMLAIGAGLLWQAVARGSTALRRIAMTVIALTVAKVFLIDASGLTGLTRVFSFLALGLSLAGLAFLNRWAAGQSQAQDGS